MSNDKPTVVVTEADRRAAWATLRWSATCGSPFSNWFATGQLPGEHWDEQEVTDLVATAQAIAHARTMAAFEERCAAVKRVMRELELPKNRQSAAEEHLLDIYAGVFAALAEVFVFVFDDAMDFLCGPMTDDDVRALVLKGWEQ